MQRALERCDLSHLTTRLDDTEDWSRTLSSGEQQQFAFARLLINPPDIIVLDEATSALNDVTETRMMTIFHDELPQVTVIGVGRRAQHENFYDRQISLLALTGQTAKVGTLIAREPRARIAGTT